MSRIPTDEQKIVAEYMAKYPKLRGSALAQVIHGNGDLTDVSETALRQRINKIQGERIQNALADTEADGEQIAITGTITREEYDKLVIKGRKYDHLIRVLFAGAKNNIRVPEALYFDNRLICEQLRGLEPELYLKTFEIINREAGK